MSVASTKTPMGKLIRDLKMMDRTFSELCREKMLTPQQFKNISRGQKALNKVIPALERIEQRL